MKLNQDEQRCLRELLIHPGWDVAKRILAQEKQENVDVVLSCLNQGEDFTEDLTSRMRYAAATDRVIEQIQIHGEDNNGSE